MSEWEGERKEEKEIEGEEMETVQVSELLDFFLQFSSLWEIVKTVSI